MYDCLCLRNDLTDLRYLCYSSKKYCLLNRYSSRNEWQSLACSPPGIAVLPLANSNETPDYWSPQCRPLANVCQLIAVKWSTHCYVVNCGFTIHVQEWICQGGGKTAECALEPHVGMSCFDEWRDGATSETSVCTLPRPHACCCALGSPDGAGLSRDVLRESVELLVGASRSQLHARLDRRSTLFASRVLAYNSCNLCRGFMYNCSTQHAAIIALQACNYCSV